MQLPDPTLLVQLRDADPQAYGLWLGTIEKRVDHDMWMERAPVELPAIIAARGQRLGFAVATLVLLVAALALFLDHPWVASIIAALDVVALAAVFASPSKTPQP